jgi:hypothetical protein
MNLNKYDQPKDEKPKLQDWKASVPVVVLSDAIKIVGEKHGIKLTIGDDAVPTLSFRPGFKADDIGSERWSIARQVEDLFFAAVDDLTELIATGKITLPQSTYRRPS